MLSYKRGKAKFPTDYGANDIYRFYKKKYGDEAVSRRTFSQVTGDFFPELVKLIIFKNYEYKMPARLGTLRIKKKFVEPKIDENGELDTRRLSINWKKTKQLWQEKYPGKTGEELKKIKDKPLVRELNEHTDGYRFVWYWDKLTSNVPNQSAYYLNMARANDKMLARASKFNNLEFYE